MLNALYGCSNNEGRPITTEEEAASRSSTQTCSSSSPPQPFIDPAVRDALISPKYRLQGLVTSSNTTTYDYRIWACLASRYDELSSCSTTFRSGCRTFHTARWRQGSHFRCKLDRVSGRYLIKVLGFSSNQDLNCYACACRGCYVIVWLNIMGLIPRP